MQDSLSGRFEVLRGDPEIELALSITYAGPIPVFFLMDEFLSGTNSHDRLEGRKLVVRSLTEHGAIGIVSTHDLALAEIPETMVAGPLTFNLKIDSKKDNLFSFTNSSREW